MFSAAIFWLLLGSVQAASFNSTVTDCPSNNVASNRSAWGNYDISTDYGKVTPDTGKVREYDLVITNMVIAPDGYESPGMVINGQYPGPVIEANWGDTLRITVHNNLTNLNGTTLHWHGVRMLNQNWEDGTPGLTEIKQPGFSHTYEFRVRQYGVSWYHSHFGLQYPDGLYGALKFHGPTSMNYDEDIGPVLITDWLHQTASSVYYKELEGTPPVPDSNLMQGIGIFNCVPGTPCTQRHAYYTIDFVAGKTYKISLVNTGTVTQFTFWIDGHDFAIVATDFVPIEPYRTSTVNIAIGQRYDIIVTANATFEHGSSFWLHARDCANSSLVSTLGIIRYEASDSDPYTIPGGQGRDQYGCLDPPETELVPVVKRTVGTPVNDYDPADYLYVALQGYPILSQIHAPLFKWILANTSLYINWSEPTNKLINDFNDTTGAHMAPQLAPIFLDYPEDSWVYFLIESNYTIPIPDRLPVTYAHPIHLHGHDFVILAQGLEPFNASSVTLNLNNPPRRDVAMLPSNGYLMIGFQVDNPGAWLMHCHIPWHASSGMALQFIEMPAHIPPQLNQANVMPGMNEECASWTLHYDTVNIPADAVQDESGI